ncbi:chromosome condensation protein CrcB [Kocuria marina]|uniref:Fluoride-specific ion channel FluC n=1 Tax=Kocuria marina TaxID=223184 RepID=A0A0B0D9Y3_9MICC|nr:fluoride efflux transporter CrcB [Kocuria marina]KHE73580.1 chromosome condensation protein CrcB [Kocuria marina]
MSAALAVALGGAVGAVLRFLVDRGITARWAPTFPAATLLINVTGSFVLGVVTGLSAVLGPVWTLALGTGLCGGYTTFSTAMVDAVRLARAQRAGAAVVSVLGTVLWSLLAVAAGLTLGTHWAS